MSEFFELVDRLCSEGVEWRELGSLGKFYSGLTGKSKEDFTSNGNAAFITYMNVYSNLALKTDVKDFVHIRQNEKQNTIQYGDVIFTGSSETLDECGMSSVLTTRPQQKLYLNSFCFGYRFDNLNLFLPDFTKHLFRSDEIRKQIIKTANGVTRFNVSKKKMQSVKIPLPPLEVQREVVGILDLFTGLTAELTAELELRKKQYAYYREVLLSFDEKSPSVIKEMTKRLCPNGIEWKTLGDIGKVSMCKRIMKSETSDVGDVPFYKIGTFGKTANAFISRELFQKYKEAYSYPNKGDVLISAAGTIGRSVIFDGKPAYFQDSNIVWIANDETKILNRFLYYWYQTKPWKVSTGGTIDRLYNDDITKTKVPLPPLEVQSKIVEILDQFHTLTTSLTEGIPAEIEARRKQYHYYRNKLLSFKELAPSPKE